MDTPLTSLTPVRLQQFPVSEMIALSQAASWNQTEQDWRRMLELSPELCLGMRLDGKLVASATALCYGPELAWIGMVLTLPEYRGRGLARGLLGELLGRLRGMGIAQVKLDATELGAGLYREFGFMDEQPVERWEREGGPMPVAGNGLYEGEDRVLRALARDGLIWTRAGGAMMARQGAVRSYLGPIVAPSQRVARELLRHVDGAAAYWDLLPEFSDARSLAWYLGFRPVRRLTRMSLGEGRKSKDVYGIAGFEYG